MNGPGSESEMRPHVGAAMDDRLPAAHEECPVGPEHYRQCELVSASLVLSFGTMDYCQFPTLRPSADTLPRICDKHQRNADNDPSDAWHILDRMLRIYSHILGTRSGQIHYHVPCKDQKSSVDLSQTVSIVATT